MTTTTTKQRAFDVCIAQAIRDKAIGLRQLPADLRPSTMREAIGIVLACRAEEREAGYELALDGNYYPPWEKL